MKRLLVTHEADLMELGWISFALCVQTQTINLNSAVKEILHIHVRVQVYRNNRN